MRFSTTLALLLAPCSLLPAQLIRNPRASLVDIPGQQERFNADGGAAGLLGSHSCLKLPAVVAPQGRIEIPHHYLSGSNGPTNPAEAEATKPYSALENRVASGSSQWLATSNEAEAQCALDQLDGWAKAGTLLDYDPKESSQAWYQVEWTLASLGVSNSVLVNDTKLNAEEQARVNAWLRRAALRLVSFDKPRGNNHHYWRGLAAASIGVSTGDESLFALSIATYKDAITEIDERGGLPLELARHENAIRYQGFAIQPLILIAQFAARQGIDLYGLSVHGKTLRDAIVFFGNAAADPSLVRPYTTEAQRGTFSAGDFAADAFFVSKFGPAGLPPNVADSVRHNTWQTRLGGDPLLFLPAQAH